MTKSKKLKAILELAMGFKELTNHRYDPMIGGSIAAWKTSLKRGVLPKKNTIGFSKSKEEIDLDGMLKGYAIDAVVETLNHAGYKNVYVEWGGDIRVTGTHPHARPWRVWVGGLHTTIELEGALATSGNGKQRWTISESGDTYTHIVDPFTLQALKVERHKRVSVRAPTAALADALATAYMTIADDKDEASKWVQEMKRKMEGIEFLVLDQSSK